MNVLKFNKVYLTILGIYPVNRISKSCVGSTRNTGFYFFLLSLSTLAGSSAAYMHRNFSDWSNLPSYTTALCVIVACFGNIGSFISTNANRKHIEHVRAELQQIVNKAVGTPEFEIYRKVERKCRIVTKWIPILNFIITILLSILPSVIHSAVCMLDGNLDTNTWFFATKLSVPFSTSSVFGWYMLVIWQTFSATTFLFVLTAIITYLLSCCFYVQALRDHFKSTFDKIDTKIVADATASTDEVNTETLVALEKVVSFHVKSMEIFKTIGYISSGTIFYQLITNVIFVAMGIFHLEQSLQHFDNTTLVAFFVIFCGLFWSFLLCYSANLSTDVAASIGDIVYSANWRKYPLFYRKYVLLLILRSQSPAYFKGFKVVRCTLESFGKLCKSAFSYYLILRSFSK